MRNLIGTAVAVAFSMVLFPNCAGTANAGVAVTVSVGASAGYPAGYVYEDWDNEVMDWDNVIILNDNLLGYWVLLPGNHWALRCRSMWYNSGTLEWTFGPWWYDYSVVYGSPLPGVRFHMYMASHYPTWHNRYFTYHTTRYVPVAERRIIINRGRYYRHDEPAIYRTRPVHHTRPATIRSTTVITRDRNTDRPAMIDNKKGPKSVRQSRPETTRRTTTVTRQREIKQPVCTNGGNRSERIKTSQGNSRQTEVTRTRTTTREHSNGKGNTSTRTGNRTTTRSIQRGR
ncbi:MAG: hypothetical protein JXA71_17665 [Chitinispirillaceae bacterium]|nr:hypothetical protein [Chitinispirillaceae bacterium]